MTAAWWGEGNVPVYISVLSYRKEGKMKEEKRKGGKDQKGRKGGKDQRRRNERKELV